MSRTNGWRALLVVASLVAVLVVSQQASAVTTLYWQAVSGTAGGSGTWDTSTNHWATTATGVAGLWTPNDGTLIAYLGTTAGTLTLGDNINVAMLRFQITGDCIAAGTKVITLFPNGTDPNMNVGSNMTATIRSVIADCNSVGLQWTVNSNFGPGFSKVLVLTAHNTYAGPTNITGEGGAGTLKLDFSFGDTASNIIPTTSQLQMGGTSANLTINPLAGSSGTIQTFAGALINAGTSSITYTNVASNTSMVNLGTITRNTGGVLSYTAVPANGNYLTTSDNANFAGGQKTILGGWFTIAGTDWATVNKSSGSPVIVKLGSAGVGSYTTNFTTPKADVDVTATGTTNVDCNVVPSINSLRFNSVGAHTVNLNGDLTIATGGILETSTVGNNAVTLSNGRITSANKQDLIVTQNNTTGANSPMTINSTIADCGATSIGLTKAGNGVLILGGNNSYTGPTTITSTNTYTGVIVTSNNALGTADCGTTLMGGPGGGGQNVGTYLQFRNVQYLTPESITLGRNASSSAAMDGNSANANKTGQSILADGGASTFNGDISSPYGGLMIGVAPGSSLTLNGAITAGNVYINSNDAALTYSGSVTLGGNSNLGTSFMAVLSGTVTATSNNALGGASSGFALGRGYNYGYAQNPAELDLQNNITLGETQAHMYFAGSIRNVGGANVMTNGFTAWGTFYRGGTQAGTTMGTQSGILNVYADGGSLTIGGIADAFDLGSSNGTDCATHAVNFAGTGGTGLVSGAITNSAGGGPMGVKVSGGATWTFTAANTYKGPTGITGGNLVVKNATALGANSGTTGEVIETGQTPGTTVSASGSLTISGLSVNYPVTLSGGSLLNDCTTTTTVLSPAGKVIAVLPTNGGSGYLKAPTVTVATAGGTQATARAYLGLTNASIASISGGTLYQVGDTVGVAGGATGAFAYIQVDSVDVNGAITGWHLTDPGAGFDCVTLPTKVENARYGTTATFTAAATPNFCVSMIAVTQVGTSYVTAPGVSFTNASGDTAGSGAAASAFLNAGVYLQGTSNNIGGEGNITDCALISGNGGFTKTGAGNLLLNVANTYTGPTGISAGTVTLGANYAIPSTSAVTLTGGALAMNGYTDCVTSLALAGGNVTGLGTLVVQGGKLSGVGSISPVLKLLGGANLAPGNSPGSVTLGRASFGSSADNYTVDINGLGVANYDNVLYKVAMTLNNARLVINDLNYVASAALNDKFFIMDSDNNAAGASVSGTFNGLAQGATVYGASGIGYTVNYNLGGDPKGTSNDVALTTLSLPSVPEPATLFLMGTGALGVAAFIRRQRMK